MTYPNPFPVAQSIRAKCNQSSTEILRQQLLSLSRPFKSNY